MAIYRFDTYDDKRKSYTENRSFGPLIIAEKLETCVTPSFIEQ